MSVPPQPTIFHITHVDNLAGIVASGGLVADVFILQKGGPTAAIGMSNIKQRRLTLPVSCHPGLRVGDCVPFYFCPRSIMLYVIHCRNAPALNYRGGQGPIIHLEANLHDVIHWANTRGVRWAFSTSNAGARYADFFADASELHRINWAAVGAKDFRHRDVKEGKQAEFLVHGPFPWMLISRIGVSASHIAPRVRAATAASQHQPPIEVRTDWYF